MNQMEKSAGAETNGETNGEANKRLSVERIYQKKSQLEHILLRPDTYIGSVEQITEVMWVYDNEKSALTQREISYVPGLYKIFDEILVNAADNKVRDPKMDTIKVDIDAENNIISVYNNGKGIPVVMHKDEKMYVPTLIFGHLLTSSNYNDEEEKVTGGRNGYGAKLCNIFSTKFVLETTSKEYKKSFKQTWKNNMGTTAEPNIQSYSKGDDYTRVTFSPDLPKFKMAALDKDTVALLSKRAFDVAASTRGVKVYLNGKLLPIKSFKDYVDLCLKGREDDDGNNVKAVYETVNERWEIAVAPSDKGYQQVSFVNSIATTKGGRHVDYVTDMMVKQLQEHMKKKNKGGVAIKPHQVKNHIWVFVNCLIVNPTFDSQTKENMTLQTKSFGSKCQPTEKFYTQMMKSGIIESVMAWARFKAQNELNKQCSGKKHAKLKGIPKLEDANDAGTRNSINCTLILTEGDSAKSLAVSGLGVIGRDKYGVFPLKGKLLNVREATHKQILENAEINNLVKILGLQYKKSYENETDLKTLRYGKLMIMTDQDQDGSHIKGLLINFFHHNWPSLLRLPFLEEFITPIVKATKGTNTSFSFYSLPEFEEWKSKTENWPTFRIKYYKGLGTSTSQEAKSYFSDMQRHRITFRYDGDQDDYAITMAFSKKHVEQRKEWLTSWMDECKRRRELGLAELYLYEKNTKQVNYRDFVNKELVLFSNLDNERSIPSLVDGLKPGQRKVLFTCIKRNDKKEIKVAQLAGSVAEHSAYHHGEASLMSTIIGLAQNYVGSNNINLLCPSGQFGTRLQGGKDAASPRYIFTMMSKLTRLIFHPHDDPLLCHLKDDNQRIEPEWYMPIIPMVLVNGADGIGTGWMTKIPNFNPRDLVANIKRMLNGEEPTPMIPWFKGYRGTIEMLDSHRYACSGEVSVIGDNEVEVTELPIRVWTQVYKESVMESLLHGSEKQAPLINDYKEYHTDTTVRFLVNVTENKLEKAEQEGLHRLFKLQTTLTTTSMVLFDANGCLKKYESVEDILREFYDVRLRFYQKRKNYLEGVLQAESRKLSNQARFICEKCDGVLTVENKKGKALIEELRRRNYDPDPVRLWKLAQDKNAVLEQDAEQDADLDAEDDLPTVTSKSSDFDYLLDMPMRSLTYEKKEDLLKKKEAKLSEYEFLRSKTPADLWCEDLDHFLVVLQEVEDSELEEKSKKTVKMPMLKQKKKQLVAEVLPSPKGRRILPVIDAELRKKAEMANKAKDARAKKALKSPEISIEKDSFDLEEMSHNKSLYERLGLDSPVKGAAKKKSPAKKKDSAEGDEIKPTKLKFSGAATKKAGLKDDSADESEKDDFDLMLDAVPLREKTSRRAAASVKYTLDTEDVDSDELREDDTFQVSDSDEEFEFDKPKTAPRKKPMTKAVIDSDDESPPKKPKKTQPPPSVSSDDLFDSLIGKTTPKKDEEPPKKDQEPPKKPPVKDVFALESDDDMEEAPAKAKAPAKKPAASRQKKTTEPKEPKAKKEPKEPKAKKAPAAAKPKKAPAAKKQRKAMSDSDDDISDGGFDANKLDSNDVEPKQRGAQRARKAVKYDFDSDNSM